jgi:hypothetical protein
MQGVERRHAMARAKKTATAKQVDPEGIRRAADRIEEITGTLRATAKSLKDAGIESVEVVMMPALGRAFKELNRWEGSLQAGVNASMEEGGAFEHKPKK